MTKQEKIIEAYGEFYNEAELISVSNDGYINLIDERGTHCLWNNLLMITHRYDNHKYRPITLEGIEDNNGWIPFTHEKLPPNTDYHVTNSRGQIIVLSSNVMNSITINSLADLTYYRPIPIPKPPVY